MTQEQWDAIKNNDSRYDGLFYYGLRTTKNVCRPSCPARQCRPENVIIFDTLQEAVAAGFRPCARCRPEVERWRGAKAELAKAADRYIDEHAAEKFSLEKMAGALYVNGNYLLRAYKEVTGRTLLWRHNSVRCRRAAEMLERPEYSVAYISDTVGFVNASHFARVFKAYYQMSPTQYRRAHFEQFV